MSSYYYVGSVIGYVFSLKEALAPFTVEIPEVFHLEPRFDPKTGKPTEPFKVIDTCAQSRYTIDGNDLYLLDAIETLVRKLDCHFHYNGCLNDSKSLSIIFTPFDEDPEEQLTPYNMRLCYNGTQYDAEKHLASCYELAEKLRSVDLNPGQLVFTTYCWWA